MSFSSVLKTIGKDLKDVGGWIDEGLKVAAPVIGIIDPPLAAIITSVENVLTGLTANPALSAANIQAIVQAITTIEALKAAGTPAPVTSTATVTQTTT